MKKNLVKKTIEGFIHKLNEEGHSKYASELRYIIAMSRKKKDAETALTSISTTLLIHILKYIALPHSRDKNKWLREIRGYLIGFDTRNQSPRNQPWLSIEFITKDLNDRFSGSKFIPALEYELEGYSNKEINDVKGLLKTRNLKGLGIKAFYTTDYSLNISIKGINIR
jgi:hypothetical protein